MPAGRARIRPARRPRRAAEPAPIAIVGIAGTGRVVRQGRERFRRRSSSGRRTVRAIIASARWSCPVDRFRIPPRELEEMLPQQSLMLRVAAEAIADAGWDARLAAADGRPGRDRARPEHDQLPPPLVAGGQGPAMEPGARPGPLAGRARRTGSTSCARPPGRRCRPTGRWARSAAWSPAGSPASSASAARASRSRARRPPGSRRWPSPSTAPPRRARRGDRRRGRPGRRRSGGPRAPAAR